MRHKVWIYEGWINGETGKWEFRQVEAKATEMNRRSTGTKIRSGDGPPR